MEPYTVRLYDCVIRLCIMLRKFCLWSFVGSFFGLHFTECFGLIRKLRLFTVIDSMIFDHKLDIVNCVFLNETYLACGEMFFVSACTKKNGDRINIIRMVR